MVNWSPTFSFLFLFFCFFVFVFCDSHLAINCIPVIFYIYFLEKISSSKLNNKKYIFKKRRRRKKEILVISWFINAIIFVLRFGNITLNAQSILNITFYFNNQVLQNPIPHSILIINSVCLFLKEQKEQFTSLMAIRLQLYHVCMSIMLTCEYMR